VAKIDPASFLVQVQSADANLANARAKVLKSQADLAMKKLTFARNGQLREKDLIAQSDVDTAKSDYDQAVAQLALDAASVKQAQAALDSARINLNYTDILSPVDGVVVSRSVDVGQTVAASYQAPVLFHLAANIEQMQVQADVDEADIGVVKEGVPVTFIVEGSIAVTMPFPIGRKFSSRFDDTTYARPPVVATAVGLGATVTVLVIASPVWPVVNFPTALVSRFAAITVVSSTNAEPVAFPDAKVKNRFTVPVCRSISATDAASPSGTAACRPRTDIPVGVIVVLEPRATCCCVVGLPC